MPKTRRRRRRSAQRAVVLPHVSRQAILASALLLLLLLGALMGVRLWSFVHRISPRTTLSDVLSLVNAAPGDQPGTLAWKVAHNERINILLLGYGGPGHDGPYLTDSMMLVSLLPKTHQAAMVSIPRDLWVTIPAFTDRTYAGKINEAYEIGIDDASWKKKRPEYTGRRTAGGELASAVVGAVTGLHIDYWLGVDFQAFRDVVNELGGIDLTVDQVLHDTQFPKGETDDYMTVHFNAGPQHMDGERALQFTRSRYSTNDFDRSKRQQKVLLAVRQKVFSINAVPKMLGLFDALQKNVITNLTIADLRLLAEAARSQPDEDVHRIALDNTNLLRDTSSAIGQYILIAKDKDFEALQVFLAQVFLDRATLAEGATVQVLNGTDRYPLQPNTAAEGWTDLIATTGLKMATPGEANNKRYVTAEIHDYSGGRARQTVDWLAGFLHATVVAEPAEPAPAARVVVILGSDFTLRTLGGTR